MFLTRKGGWGLVFVMGSSPKEWVEFSCIQALQWWRWWWWCGTGVVEKTARDLIVKIATALPALHLLDTSPLLRIFHLLHFLPLLHCVTRLKH